MAENGYTAAPIGHMGRIPNYGKTQVNPMGSVEPPACIQNAMMTKDKKPFTYTPGGLDLSQIKTPSMARRLARQRSLEEHEQAYAQQQQQNNAYHPPGPGGVPPPPPPPPSKIPAPPPPPALVIEAPSKSPKPIAPGERPEIVIPENPIGMLRKTNSPYHWEAEQAEQNRMGNVPKFVEKVPSPLTVKLPNAQPPQNYAPQQPRQNYQNTPPSPIHRPEAQYANQQYNSPNISASPPVRETLQRQDSQFNKSPQPFAGQSPISNGSTYSPSPNNNWRQPEKRDSPANIYSSSPQSPPINRGAFSPSVQQQSPQTQQFSPNNYTNQSPSGPGYHTLPKAGGRQPDYMNNGQVNNSIYNNTRQPSPPKADVAPWRTNAVNRHNSDVTYNNNQQDTYIPTWKLAEMNNNVSKPTNNVTPKQEQYVPPWVNQDSNNNKVQQNYTPPWKSQESDQNTEPRYQSSMSIPVTPRKPTSQPEYNNSPSQKEVVYVNQEPIYYCPDSPKSIPPWVKTQKEKTKTPPPAWVQRPLERKSVPRELVTPPRETEPEPEWIRKSTELQRGPRDVISPPKYQQPVQPTWSTRPSENRKSVPKDTPNQGGRVIPIQMEVSGDQRQGHHQPPNLRIVIDMNQNPQGPTNGAYSQPTQRIMRVLSPQLVRFDDNSKQPDLPTLNRTFQNQPDLQSKTRIIPIQIEGGSNGGPKQSFGGRY